MSETSIKRELALAVTNRCLNDITQSRGENR